MQDRDEFDKFVLSKRMDLRKGVEIQKNKNAITSDMADRLKTICDKIAIAFFYPVVFRVSVAAVPTSIMEVRNSGLLGSKECFVNGLDERLGAFDVMFLDHSGDPEFDQLKALTVGDCSGALSILERRCRP